MTTPYQIAERFVGIKEIPGKDDNYQILSMLKLDNDWPEHDEVPWCSGFANYVAWLLRLPRSKSLMARSWLDVGIPIPLKDAKAGYDVVILSRGTNPKAGHVGFFSSLMGPKIYLLGGNQSDTVCVSDYNRSRFLGARRLGGPAGSGGTG